MAIRTVKMLAGAAGPDFRAHAGDIVEVEAKFARDLVEGGYAELVDEPVAEDNREAVPNYPESAEPEAAVAVEGETAEQPRPQARRGRQRRPSGEE